jgi:hypothetical protein
MTIFRTAAWFVASLPVLFGAPWSGVGPVSFRVTLAGKAATTEFEPLLSVGKPGAGDIVVVRRLSDGRVCFGWEQTETGAIFSRPIPVGAATDHTVMVSLGGLLPAGELEGNALALREFAVVQMDGRTVLAVRGNSARNAGSRWPSAGISSAAHSRPECSPVKSRTRNPVQIDTAFAAATESRALLVPAAHEQEEAEYPGRCGSASGSRRI